MTGKQRRSLLFTALAGVLAWSAWLAFSERPQGDGEAVSAVAEPERQARHASRTLSPASAPVRAQPQPQLNSSSRLALARVNLFPEQTWYIPPPPPPPPPYVPPPPPQAPQLPFSYMGRWQDAGQTTYYLTRGAVPISVRVGQVLDGVWRLEPPAGNVLNFTYLPLNQTRSLRTGD